LRATSIIHAIRDALKVCLPKSVIGLLYALIDAFPLGLLAVRLIITGGPIFDSVADVLRAILNSPDGSASESGLLLTYAYVFSPPSRPIGSDWQYLPVAGSKQSLK
jgi:hypothetical protein